MQALVFTQLKCEVLKSVFGILEGLPAFWRAEGPAGSENILFTSTFLDQIRYELCEMFMQPEEKVSQQLKGREEKKREKEGWNHQKDKCSAFNFIF